MKYLLDTANLDAIRYYTDIFPIAGVTSYPRSLYVRNANQRPWHP